MTSTESSALASARRRALTVAVSALCTEGGFGMAENAALESLTEMLQSYITEMGRSAKQYCELAGRTEPMLTDVTVSLIEMGADIEGLPAYARRANRLTMTAQPQARTPGNPKVLQTGTKKPHPSYVPEHLPAFPDPHTYIRTPTFRPPASDYQVIRETAASQRRDIERALTRFIAKTGDTQSLFKDDKNSFPLIAPQPLPAPYLLSLVGSDVDVTDETSDEESMDTTSTSQQQTAPSQTAGTRESKDGSGEGKGEDSSQDLSQDQRNRDSDSIIDNPFLQPARKPPFRRKLSAK
ncbi:transcription initiation factor TFIID subunit 8-like [Branchiostoma lanceolatum]|uniref:transcription initiation factor TFIID subunit 8-like n=1 Tax=Branchiostoma lanceolatum TaxID=7740 RepID=UPI0034559C81